MSREEYGAELNRMKTELPAFGAWLLQSGVDLEVEEQISRRIQNN